MSRTSTRAIARSARPERVLTGLSALLLLAAGVAGLLVGLGVFGSARAARPVADPIGVRWLQSHAQIAHIAGLVLGIVALLVGLWWLLRSLRPERHPQVVLDAGTDHELTIKRSALTNAVAGDAETVAGISRAKASIVGRTESPALRLHLWLQEGTDVRAVWQDLDRTVLARARGALGVQTLPTAVHLELDSAERERVG